MNLRSFFSISLMIVLMSVAPAVHSGDRPELYQFAHPYPEQLPTFETDLRAPLLSHRAVATISLDVDAHGVVQSLSSDTTVDFGLTRYVDSYLRSLRFVPAVFRENEVAATVPVVVRLSSGKQIPRFSFPLDTAANVDDGQLYRDMLSLNDIDPPRLTRFPSYYGASSRDTVSHAYRYVLLAVDLDATGRLTDSRLVVSTYPAFEEQVRSALLWSDFEPARISGESIAATMYVLVSFFVPVAYPTETWPPPSDTDNPLEFLRIRAFPDTEGLMAPAIPENYPYDKYALGPNYPLGRGAIEASMEIDTSGQARLVECNPTSRELRLAVRDAIHNTRFYPAMDFAGRPRKYKGTAVFHLSGTASVRIVYEWLP